MAHKSKKHKYTVVVEGAKRPSLITSDSEAANALWEMLVEQQQKEIGSNVTLTRDGVPVREFIFIPKPDERERFAIIPTEAFRHAGYADRLKKGKPVGARHATNQPDWLDKGLIFVHAGDSPDLLLKKGEYERADGPLKEYLGLTYKEFMRFDSACHGTYQAIGGDLQEARREDRHRRNWPHRAYGRNRSHRPRLHRRSCQRSSHRHSRQDGLRQWVHLHLRRHEYVEAGRSRHLVNAKATRSKSRLLTGGGFFVPIQAEFSDLKVFRNVYVNSLVMKHPTQTTD